MDATIRDRAIWIYHSLLESKTDWFQDNEFVVAPGAWAKFRIDDEIAALGRLWLLICQDGQTYGVRTAHYFDPPEVAQVIASEVFRTQI
jgi:hypothetical protein